MNVDSIQTAGVKIRRGYDHAQWENKRRFLRFLIRVIGFNFLVKMEQVDGVENVPAEGSAILMINHIASVDPIVTLQVLPRHVVPMAKIEVYDLPVVGIFPRLYGVIPVRREEMDRRALSQAFDVLHAGEILLIAPEGTRSPALQPAKVGVAYLASRNATPIVPVAIEGTPGFPTLRGSKRWKGPGIRLRFGRAFRFRPDLTRPDRTQLRQMTDEAMYALARYLPEHRRGVYADLTQATMETLEML
jgi:1-acyl-sn-glycerol-3-phosphate acyltransferase